MMAYVVLFKPILVCQGKITPADCQAWFLGDWKAEYDRRFGAQ